LVFPTTSQAFLLLELGLSLLALLLALQDFFGTFPLGLLSALSPLDAFQLRVLAGEGATFHVAGTDTESSTHLAHLCLLGSSQCMRIGRLEIADVDVRAGLGLSLESGTKSCDFGFDGIFVNTKAEDQLVTA
jgi:hypothetical protein